jgi:hypothetical protein
VSLFRLIEGIVSIARPAKPLGYAYFENDYVPAVNQMFDFGGPIRKDVYIKVSADTIFKFDSTSSDPILVNPQSGVVLTEQWVKKVYVTFSNSPVTHMVLLANG